MYDIPKTTLRAQMTSQPPRSNYRPKVQKLTKLEEGVIVNHIFNLDSRGFSP
jgi:hypothetical protein